MPVLASLLPLGISDWKKGGAIVRGVESEAHGKYPRDFTRQGRTDGLLSLARERGGDPE